MDINGIEILVIDQYTAIPYILINGESKTASEVVVFCHDFFDTFLEYKKLFENIA